MDHMVKYYLKGICLLGSSTKEEDDREFSLSEKVQKYKYLKKLDIADDIQPTQKEIRSLSTNTKKILKGYETGE